MRGLSADNAAVIRKDPAMRALAALIPLTLFAAPAQAADTAAKDSDFQIPAELTDPAMAETLGKMLGSLTKAMMDMPVGEVQAAIAGREPTAADKRRTVRDISGRDPDFERKVERQVAQSVPRMQAGMKAMAASLPAMAKALEAAAEQMESSIDRATANLPQPGYPKQ
jgi:hypothetical protein